MNKFLYSILILLLCSGLNRLNAQEITQQEIPMQPVKVINFKELADYEKLHPLPKKKRFVEQGEDREHDYKFIPKPVGTDALRYDIQLPRAGQRAVTNSPAPSLSFNGTMDNSTLIPPDIRGSAGTNHIMETTNQEFKIYTKSGSLVSTLSIVNFFASTGGSGYFDPHVLYDANNGRWIICIAGSVSNGNGGVFLGISQTSDPSGSWYLYSFDGIGNANDFLDYPLMGYNTNWVVVTANDFLSTGGVTGKIYVLNRASLYNGTASSVSTYTDANVFSLAPAQTMDPSQTTLYMVQDWNGNSGGYGYVRIGKITGTAAAPSYTAGTTLGVNQPWSETSVKAPQSGSSQKLESGDTRIGNAVYVNGSLWFCHTAFLPSTSPTRDAVQWWQVNPATPSIQQFGRVDGGSSTGMFYFYPSIAVNSTGDVLLGHCQSSTTSFASASYSTRSSTDAANTIQTPYTYKSGVASYYKTYGGSRNRWGDYTGAAVDPSNNSFWNFSEWANTNNNWATVIANVSIAPAISCDVVTGLNTTNITDSSATLNWTTSTNALSYNVQYRAIGAGSWNSANTSSTSFNLINLSPGASYEWQVQTVCSNGTSSFTASANFTTTGVQPCNSPTSLSTSSITSTTATLSWAVVNGAIRYLVQYRLVGASSWNLDSTTSNSYNVINLVSNSNYEWQVQSVCNGSSSRFSTSVNFTTLAVATCTDAYEPNNSSGTAKTPSLNTTFTGLISPSTDVDWYKFSTVSPNIKIKIDLTNLPADYDMVLYKSNASAKLGSSVNTGLTNEQIKYNPSNAGTYYLKVYGYNGANSATSCYNLRISVASTAWSVDYASAETASNKTDVLEAEPVMKLYPNPANDKLNIEFLNTSKGKVKMNIYNLNGQRIWTGEATAEEGINLQTVNTNNLSNGIYVFEVYSNGEIQRQQFVIGR